MADVAVSARGDLFGASPPPAQTLRCAIVITGGVSLAVWMGGIAREMDLLTKAGGAGASARPPGAVPLIDGSTARLIDLYQGLTTLLGWDVEIDVLAGTSAGGVNAALLGVSNALRGDLGKLRDLWLEDGAFDKLLRDPSVSGPLSVLQGDGVLLPGIREAICEIRKSAPQDATLRTTTLNITTTLLRGEATRFSDSYGTTVSDSNHLGLFTFTQEDLADRDNDAAVALAGRSSASFPGAFEPAFLPVGRSDIPGHPDMAPFLPITTSHFVSDGGQLENQPVAPALQAVFDRPDADDPVRRVMLYVVPSAGDSSVAVTPETWESPPSLLRALAGDLQASRSQSISTALAEITRHNDAAATRQEGWRRLARLAAMAVDDHAVPLVDPSTFDAYRRQRAEEITQPVVAALLTLLYAQKEIKPGEDLSPAGLQAAAAKGILDWLPGQPPAASDITGLAKLGLVAFDDIHSVLLRLRRSAYSLCRPTLDSDRAGLRAVWAGLTADPPATTPPATTPPATTPPAARNQKTLWALVRAALGVWDGKTETAERAAVSASRAWAAELATGELSTVEGGPPAQGPWAPLHAGLPGFVATIAGLVERYPSWQADSTLSAGRARRDDACGYLTDFLVFLTTDPLDRLVSLHILSHLLLPEGRANAQPVEFIQVSADTRSQLDPSRSTALDKLTGMQLHHFGAFYRGSWRANDWMWGRLDGAGWLVHVLLSPQRLLDLREQAISPATFGADLLAKLQEVCDGIGPPPPAVQKELQDLFATTATPPKSLPQTSGWVAVALQRVIAAQELACVAQQLEIEIANRDVPSNQDEIRFLGLYRQVTGQPAAASPAIAPNPVPVERAASLLQACKVSNERLKAQQKSALFVRTTVQTAAVTAAVINGTDPKPPTALRPALSLLRQSTRAAWEIVNSVTHGRALSTTVAALGALLLGISLTGHSNGIIQAIGAASIGVGVVLAIAVLRPVLMWVGRLVVVLAVVALATAGFVKPLRHWLFPRLSDAVVPWLGRHAWIWLLVVLLVLYPPFTPLLAAVSKRFAARRQRKRRRS